MTFTAPMAYALDWVIFFSDQKQGADAGRGVCFWCDNRLGRPMHVAGWQISDGRGLAVPKISRITLVGGTLMGIGGVTAMGCTVGQGLSGISTLSAASFVAVGGHHGLAPSLALKYQGWRLERLA
jgi:uncharacterized membrane protein YedE/YeeE